MFYKIKLFIFFFFLLTTKSLLAQEENVEIKDESFPFDAVIESEMGGKRMKFYGNTRFNFNQAYFSNWISGGESALTFLYGLDYNFNYSDSTLFLAVSESLDSFDFLLLVPTEID